MATVDHSQAHVDLAGGAENMCEKMKSAYSDGNLQWALELAEHLIQTNNCVSLAKVKKFPHEFDQRVLLLKVNTVPLCSQDFCINLFC